MWFGGSVCVDMLRVYSMCSHDVVCLSDVLCCVCWCVVMVAIVLCSLLGVFCDVYLCIYMCV